jgi:hypothetical protein
MSASAGYVAATGEAEVVLSQLLSVCVPEVPRATSKMASQSSPEATVLHWVLKEGAVSHSILKLSTAVLICPEETGASQETVREVEVATATATD